LVGAPHEKLKILASWFVYETPREPVAPPEYRSPGKMLFSSGSWHEVAAGVGAAS
jgi:hypothetical protein